MLDKLAPCDAPCCVQARGGERPLGPDVPQRVPVPAVQAGEDQDGEPAPALSNLGRHLRQERRRMRKEKERRIKEAERLMIESDSTSEEEICQEMSRMTLDKMAVPRDYYSNTATVQKGVCGTIQISGRLHVQHLPCNDHQNDQTDEEYDDDPDTQECDYKAEDNTKLEVIQPEFDDDTARFEAERSDAEHADLREDDDQEDETRVHDAEQADGLEVEDDDVVGDEGDEDLGEEEANVNDVPEEEGNQDWASEELEGENEHDEGHDDNEYEEGYNDDDYDYDDTNNYDSCNDCDEGD